MIKPNIKKIILLALCLVFTQVINAQIISYGKAKMDSIPGIKWYKRNTPIQSEYERGLLLYVQDSATQKSLPNVYVNIKSGKNNYNFYTDTHGSLNAQITAKDSIDILLSYMGYNIVQGRIPYPIWATATMSMKKNMIGQIIVKGNLVAIVNKGDTVSFNAAAFKTMKGDRMVDLFKKFPGMTFENGILMYMGSPIDQIRFDNKALFGNDAHLALETMWADEAIRVDVFKEESEFDKRNGIKGEKTRTIANVTTRSKPNKVVQTNLSLLAGYDIESSSNSRYAQHASVKGSLVNTTEKRTINAGVYNNSNTDSKGMFDIYGLPQSATTQGLSNFGHKQNLTFKYDDRRNKNFTVNSLFYVSRNQLITDNYSEREYLTGDRWSSYNNYNKSTYYSIGAKETIVKYFKDNSDLFTNIDLGVTKNVSNRESESSSRIDNRSLMSSQLTNHNKDFSTSFNAFGLYTKQFKSKDKDEQNIIFRSMSNQLQINYSIIHNSNNNDGYKIDTCISSTNPTNLILDGRGYNNGITLHASRDIQLSKNVVATITAGGSYNNSFSKQKAIDYHEVANGITDTLNSYNYTVNDITTDVSVSLKNNINISKGQHWSYSVSCGIGRIHKNRDEKFPQDYSYPRTFLKPNISALLSYQTSAFSSIRLQYTSSYSPISLEQLRPFVDNTNTMFARVGNPDLKMSGEHKLDLSLKQNTKSGTAIDARVSYSIIQNSITTKNLFFTEDTYVEKYNYNAPAGSSLSTVENMNGNRNASASFGIDGRLKALQSRGSIRLTYIYAKTGSYVNMLPTNIYTNTFRANLSLNSMFSSYLELSLSSQSNFGYDNSYLRDSRSFSEVLSCKIKAIPSNSINIGLTPIWNYYTSNANDRQVNNCLLDGFLEYRIGKLKRNAILLNVYDILNSNDALKVNMMEDYILTTSKATLGRYFMAGFRLTF